MSSFSLERQSNQSSLRLLQILECIAQSRGPVRLQELAKQVNISQSTVLRYLYALQKANYIYQDPDTFRYGMTWRSCLLTQNLNSQLSLRSISTPFINALANDLRLGTCLVVDQNMECMYLDCIDNPSGSALQRIGKIAPLHATASGKVLLSTYSDAKFDEFIQIKGLEKFTDFTITDPQKLKEDLRTIRTRGYGMDEQECEIGLRCISCPILDFNGSIIASMSVFGNLEFMTDNRIQAEVLPRLRHATETISSRLGYIE